MMRSLHRPYAPFSASNESAALPALPSARCYAEIGTNPEHGNVFLEHGISAWNCCLFWI